MRREEDRVMRTAGKKMRDEVCWKDSAGRALVTVRLRGVDDPSIVVRVGSVETEARIRVCTLELGAAEVERVALAVGDAIVDIALALRAEGVRLGGRVGVKGLGGE